MRASLSAPRATPPVVLDIGNEHDEALPRRSVCYHFGAPAAHGLRDLAGQGVSKIAGAGLFVVAAQTAGWMASAIEVAVPVGGAIAGFDIGYKIANQQFPSGLAGKAATALCALGGAAAGAAIAAGNIGAIASAAAAGLYCGVSLSHFKISDHYRGDRSVPCGLKFIIGAGSVSVGALAYAVASRAAPDPHAWLLTEAHMMSRQLGAAAEAVGVELCKEIFSCLGPFVDRKGLSLEGRIVAALKGLPAYVAASMVIGRLASDMLPDPQHSTDLEALAPMVLLGCLPNLVRGTANTLAVLHSWGAWHRAEVPEDPREHAPKKKAPRALAVSILDKAVVRWMLILPRNVVFEVLLRHGYSVGTSTLIVQGLYSFYAQFRDVLPDLMSGDGWAAG